MYRTVTGMTSDVGVLSTFLVTASSNSNQVLRVKESIVFIIESSGLHHAQA